MISESSLREEARSLLGELAPDDVPYGDIADKLHQSETNLEISLSAYGFIMWVIDHYGYKGLWKNVISSQKTVSGYVSEAVKMREDMPTMLLNAQVYVTKIFSNVADIETCFSQLEGMTFPYVLYVLFAGSGQADVVERYRPEIEETMKRYPSTLDLLPESYRKIGAEFTNVDTKQC